MFRFLPPVIVLALVFNVCSPKEKEKPPREPVTTDIRRETVEEGIEVTFYPTYGYRDGDNWIIPTRTWVHEKRRLATLFIGEVAERVLKCADSEKETPKSRLVDFPAKDIKEQKVTIQFDSDPVKEQFQLSESDPNGVIKFELKLPDATARRLLESQGSSEGPKRGWLSYRAVSQGHTGKGRVRLIEPQGVSVVSDIDDTIKVTEVPAEKAIVLRNTFCREFIVAPGMADSYKEMGDDVSFHYVSGGPWQMYGPLYDFLISGPGGFPEGTFHLSSFPKNFEARETREMVRQAVTNALQKDTASGSMAKTYGHKRDTISELMDRFPGRKFILIGDSGEIDPEVYRAIKDKYPQQVQEIRIRDVVDDDTVNHDRLEGMKIVKAEPTICASPSHYTKLAGMIEELHRPTYARNKRCLQ
ncbi:MAG: phosphatase domain-containing protein [Pyrinomonadaceae bacterium]